MSFCARLFWLLVCIGLAASCLINAMDYIAAGERGFAWLSALGFVAYLDWASEHKRKLGEDES